MYSEASKLSAAGDKVKNAREVLEQCVLGVNELEVAVGDAKLSTKKMSGYLKPAYAKMSRIRLRDAKENYKTLLALYEGTVKSFQSGKRKSNK